MFMNSNVKLTNEEYCDKYCMPLKTILTEEILFHSCKKESLNKTAIALAIHASNQFIFKLWFDNNYSIDIINNHLDGNVERYKEFLKEYKAKYTISKKSVSCFNAVVNVRITPDYIYKITSPYLMIRSLNFTDDYILAMNRIRYMTFVILGGTNNLTYPVKHFEHLNYIMRRIIYRSNGVNNETPVILNKMLDINLITKLYYKMFSFYMNELYMYGHKRYFHCNAKMRKNILYHLRKYFDKDITFDSMAEILYHDSITHCIFLSKYLRDYNQLDFSIINSNIFDDNPLYLNLEGPIDNPVKKTLWPKLMININSSFGVNKKDAELLNKNLRAIDDKTALLNAMLDCNVLKTITLPEVQKETLPKPNIIELPKATIEETSTAVPLPKATIEEISTTAPLPKTPIPTIKEETPIIPPEKTTRNKLTNQIYYCISSKIMDTLFLSISERKYYCILTNGNGYKAYNDEFKDAAIIGDISIGLDDNNKVVIETKGIRFDDNTLNDIIESYLNYTAKDQIVFNGIVMFDNKNHIYNEDDIIKK